MSLGVRSGASTVLLRCECGAVFRGGLTFVTINKPTPCPACRRKAAIKARTTKKESQK